MARQPVKRNGTLLDLGNHLNNKYFRFLNNVDKQITINLRDASIETRPVSSNGLWGCAVLPMVLMVYHCLYPLSPVYSLVAYISLSLFFYCVLHITFMTVSCLILQEPAYGGCVAPSLVSALLLYAQLGKDLSTSLLYSLGAVFSYCGLLRIVLVKLPKTFTVGEAMIVCQAMVLYVVMCIAQFWNEDAQYQMTFISTFLNTVLSSVGMIVTALYLMKDEHRNIHGLGVLVGAVGMFALILLHSLLGIDFLVQFFNYLFMEPTRVKLFTFWLLLVLITTGVLMVRTKLAVKATTVTRKSFHVLASAVFLTGIICDEELMALSAGCGLGLIILVEALRKSRIEPISSALQSVFEVYKDEKDAGTFAMTPLYLYCGLACPLVLVPRGPARRLELLAGVLAVGVGDTAASWFGARYGFNRWTGSNKTVEGTTFNILAQILLVYALQLFQLLDANNALIRTAVAATISALFEAMTEQVDNLVLPLIMLMAFQLTTPLS